MSASPIRVALCGAAGRMGREVARAVARDPGLRLAAAVERPGAVAAGTRIEDREVAFELGPCLAACDVVVDFTAPAAAAEHAAAAAAAGIPLVCGVTGLDEPQREALLRAAERVPVLHAPNMSAGVAVLIHLAREAGSRLPAGYDIEIVEMHHRRKADAPSGTALALAAALEQARPGLRRVHGRAGATGPRPAEELAIHALRGGDVVGEHHVILAGAGERLVLSHHADDRGALVAGTLAAVRFIAGRAPGSYGMREVFGLRPSGSA